MDFKAWFKVLPSLLLLSSLLKSSGCLKQCTTVITDDDRGNISKYFAVHLKFLKKHPFLKMKRNSLRKKSQEKKIPCPTIGLKVQSGS